MNTDRQFALINEILEKSGIRSFQFQVHKSTDKQYGVCEIKAVWSVPLDEVLPEEHRREIITETYELK